MVDNNETLDTMLLSAATKDWQKVAVLISKVFDDPAFDGASTSAQDIAYRIRVLGENDKLETNGNIRRWRDSTVRLIGSD